MGRKSIKGTEPVTAAEKQRCYRNRKRVNMTDEQKLYASKKLYNEMREILDGLSNSELYAIAPIMRYMELSKKELGKKRNNRVNTSKDLDDLFIDFCIGDLPYFPDAEFNRTDEENEMLDSSDKDFS